MKRTTRDIFALALRYLRPQRRAVIVLAVLLTASIALQLVLPQITRSFLDAAQTGGTLAFLASTAGLFLGSVVLGQLLDALAAYWAGRVGWSATNNLRCDLLAHVLRLDRHFYSKHSPGELIERVDGDVMALFNVFAQLALRVLGSLLLMAGALLLLAAEDWRLGLLLLGYVLLAMLVLQWARQQALPATRAMRQVTAELSSFWAERIVGGDELFANGAVDWTQEQHRQLLSHSLQVSRTSMLRLRSLTLLSEVLLAVANAALFLLGTALITQGSLTIGGLYAAFSYTSLLAHNLWQLAEQMADLQRAVVGFERIRILLDTPATVLDGPGAELHGGALSLRFQNVSYSYDQADSQLNQAVLRQLSFELPAGLFLGVVGRTGSGKSSLARLLLRFDDPQQGAILLNDIDIRQLELHALRQSVGFVPQDVQIFHASLRDNLTVFDDSLSDDRLWEALRELGLQAWAERLGAGLDSALSSSSLSAGEAQLVALTRIFLRQPALVVLDEATARLDTATEILIEHAIARLLAGRTAIVIAHRLSTLAAADRILVLENGAILEQGTARELACTASSHYAHLIATSQ